jgi:hypothetical protein
MKEDELKTVAMSYIQDFLNTIYPDGEFIEMGISIIMEIRIERKGLLTNHSIRIG